MTVYKKQNKNGFTIIELLVVVSIMVILGVIFTNILVDALRGRNKVKAINQVKQNGQVVLDRLSNEIRDADGIVCVGKFYATDLALNTIVVTNGGNYSQYRLFPPTSSENGKIQKQNFTRNDIPVGVLDTSLCSTTISIDPATTLIQSLTDTDTQNGVSINYSLIDATLPIGPTNVYDVYQQIGDNIVIKFNASAGVLAGYAYDVTVAEGGVPFSTSVQVRGVRR